MKIAVGSDQAFSVVVMHRIVGYCDRMLVIGILIALVFIIVVGTLVAAWRWRATTAALVARLDADAGRSSPSGAGSEDFEGVPPPVARYFSVALGTKPVRVARARIRWRGQLSQRRESAICRLRRPPIF